jgi:hypothetical protein
MATAINQDVLYKNATGWQRAHIIRAYDVNGNVVDNVAYSDTSIYCADIYINGYAGTKLNKVVREDKVGTSNTIGATPVVSGYSAVCTNGSVAAGTNAATTTANIRTGSWFVIT